jgi:hypothetical protein
VHARYAVVSCHVERPLDDAVWAAFARVQAAAPGGLRIAALMRPPDPAAGEDEALWLERARAAAGRGPLGHHTHFGGLEQARPRDEDPVARFRAERAWLAANGVEPRFYCGGGWYMDEPLAREVAAAGYVDCSATTLPLPWLAADEPRLEVDEPALLELGELELLELPTTHSLGTAWRGIARLPPAVHLHFHDWELTDARRRVALGVLLRVLARLRPPRDLAELAAESRAGAQRRPFLARGRA